MACFLSRRSQNTFFRITLLKNEKGTNFPIFDQKPWTNPFRKMQNFSTVLIHVFEVLNGYSSFYKLTKHFVLEHFAEKKNKISNFWP